MRDYIAELKQRAAARPAAPNNPKLSPGPTPAPKMEEVEELAWRTNIAEKFGINDPAKDLDGRLHRDPDMIKLTQDTLALAKEVLGVPKGYDALFVDGGGHGGVAYGMLNLLSPQHKAFTFDFGSFGNRWGNDLERMKSEVKETHQAAKYRFSKALTKGVHAENPTRPPFKDSEVIKASEGNLPDILGMIKRGEIKPEDDIVLVLNETTTSVSVPPAMLEEIASLRKDGSGITFLDATSGALTQKIPEGISYSMPGQKMIGSRPDPTILILDPKAKARIAEKKPWLLLNVHDLATTKEGERQANEAYLNGTLIRSTSMHDILEAHRALSWLSNRGGLEETIARSAKSSELFKKEVENHRKQATENNPAMFDFLVGEPDLRGNFNIVLKNVHPAYQTLSKEEQASVLKATHATLKQEKLAFDVAAFPGGDGFFRLTTKDIANQPDPAKEAKAVFDVLEYATAKSLVAVLAPEQMKEQETVVGDGKFTSQISPRSLKEQAEKETERKFG